MNLATWTLVKLSNACAAFSPANLSRYKDERSYSEWQFRNARWAYENLFMHYGEVKGKVGADLGCGDGRKTHFYAGLGPKAIVGVDIDPGKTARGKDFHDDEQTGSARLHFVIGSVEEIPFRKDEFDLCMSEDSFEHFPSPPGMLEEANRILKPGGRLLILFEPYFRAGGPHLYNWIRLPWAHLFFSDATMISAARHIAAKATSRHPTSRKTAQEQVEEEIDLFTHYVNKITLRRFKRYLLASSGWKLVCLHTFCTNGLFRLLIGIPLIGELFVSVFCVLEKAPGERIEPAAFRSSDKRLPKTISIRTLKDSA